MPAISGRMMPDVLKPTPDTFRSTVTTGDVWTLITMLRIKEGWIVADASSV
jgi:hypothetical protein